MIRLRLNVADVQRMRFAYSPLTEVAESLYRLHDGSTHPLYAPWVTQTRRVLRTVDAGLLRALVPAHGMIANFLVAAAVDIRTTIDAQLEFVSQCEPQRLRDDLARVWISPVPGDVQDQLAGDDLPIRAADALGRYWRLAIEPHWPRMLALLEADVAYRATRLAAGGLAPLLDDLHADVSMTTDAIEVVSPPPDSEHHLHGSGLILVPSIFAWPDLIVDPGRTGNPSITYGARGIGALWYDEALPAIPGDALSTLLGRTRAAILRAAGVPVATTDLARTWNQSASTVSMHLSALREAGLLTSSATAMSSCTAPTPRRRPSRPGCSTRWRFNSGPYCSARDDGSLTACHPSTSISS